MPERTDQPTPQPSTPTSGNRIIDEPATVQACKNDLRTPGEQSAAAGAARDQLAITGAHGNEQARSR
jgi:hypothetical protein